jgi:hypothetical protein
VTIAPNQEPTKPSEFILTSTLAPTGNGGEETVRDFLAVPDLLVGVSFLARDFL